MLFVWFVQREAERGLEAVDATQSPSLLASSHPSTQSQSAWCVYLSTRGLRRLKRVKNAAFTARCLWRMRALQHGRDGGGRPVASQRD